MGDGKSGSGSGSGSGSRGTNRAGAVMTSREEERDIAQRRVNTTHGRKPRGQDPTGAFTGDDEADAAEIERVGAVEEIARGGAGPVPAQEMHIEDRLEDIAARIVSGESVPTEHEIDAVLDEAGLTRSDLEIMVETARLDAQAMARRERAALDERAKEEAERIARAAKAEADALRRKADDLESDGRAAAAAMASEFSDAAAQPDAVDIGAAEAALKMARDNKEKARVLLRRAMERRQAAPKSLLEAEKRARLGFNRRSAELERLERSIAEARKGAATP